LGHFLKRKPFFPLLISRFIQPLSYSLIEFLIDTMSKDIRDLSQSLQETSISEGKLIDIEEEQPSLSTIE
jgi:hypothetical protein